jgi:putative transposase
MRPLRGQALRGKSLFAFTWYNQEHHHTGIALFTPADVHYGRSESIHQQRQAVMQQAFLAHPERFINGRPTVAPPPSAVWINPPRTRSSPSDLMPNTN